MSECYLERAMTARLNDLYEKRLKLLEERKERKESDNSFNDKLKEIESEMISLGADMHDHRNDEAFDDP